jgi:polyhydroxyalkanoate synthesis repressor PhaR
MLVKKYSNRRLYDTESSRYITLEELAQKIQAGSDARVVDAKTGADLTQVTLTQIIIESRRGAQLLPVPLLTTLIRMKDDALTEFFGRYVTWALELYTHTRQGVQSATAMSPFAGLTLQTNPLARFLFGGGLGFEPPPVAPPPQAPQPYNVPPSSPAPTPAPPAGSSSSSVSSSADVAELRRELEELKSALRRSSESTGRTPASRSRKRPDP